MSVSVVCLLPPVDEEGPAELFAARLEVEVGVFEDLAVTFEVEAGVFGVFGVLGVFEVLGVLGV